MQWWTEQSPEIENKSVKTSINNIISDRIEFYEDKKRIVSDIHKYAVVKKFSKSKIFKRNIYT